MKYNTYDIPAIKYFFALGNLIGDHKIDNAKNFFSLDDIDGLTIGEIKDLIKIIKSDGNTNNDDDINHITVFIAVEFKKLYNNFIYRTNTTKLGITILLTLNMNEDNEKIEEVIEKVLLNSASNNSLNESELKLTRCFLQRYRYDKMEEVDEVLSSGKPLQRARTRN